MALQHIYIYKFSLVIILMDI